MAQKIIAHRGASGYAPENTLEAFELAATMGAAGVELDVHLTKDDVLVVAHDEVIDRVSDGTGPVCEKTLKELKSYRFNKTHPEYQNATIPTMKEVFELIKPTGMMINIELKNSYIDYPQLEEKVISLAAAEGMLRRVIFSSFNHHSMLRVKALDKSLYCGLLYEATLIRPWGYALTLGMDALHPHFSELLTNREECLICHKAGMELNPWTVNRPEDLKAIIEAGADGIITNYPDVGLKLLNEAQSHQ